MVLAVILGKVESGPDPLSGIIRHSTGRTIWGSPIVRGPCVKSYVEKASIGTVFHGLREESTDVLYMYEITTGMFK